MATRKPSQRAWIHAGKTRICLGCVGKLLAADLWGAWTWGFGDCMVCGAFRLTTEREHVDDAVEIHARPKEQHQDFLFDIDK